MTRPARQLGLCLAALACSTSAAELLVAGCAEVVGDAVCERAANDEVIAWIGPADAADVALNFNNAELTPTQMHAVDGGQRLVLSLPQLSGTLTLRTPDATHTLEFAPAPSHPAWRRAEAAYAAKDYAQAQAALDEILRDPHTPLRAAALRMAGRIGLSTGQGDRARALLAAALDTATRADRRQTAALVAAALEYSRRNAHHDFVGARAALDSVDAASSAFALGRYYAAYHRGQLERATGNLRAQTRQMRSAAEIARRMGWPARELRAATSLALVELRLGRAAQALATFTDLSERLPPDLSGYDRAVFLNNRNWATLLAHESGDLDAFPLRPLTEARRLADAHAPQSEQLNARLNLVLAHIINNDLDAARDWLEQARALTATPPADLAHWALDIEARIATAAGDTDDALRLYASLATAGRALSLPATTWRALVGSAAVLAESGRRADAIAAHAEAEAALDATLVRVPLTDGRESLVSAQRHAMREHLDLLLAEDRRADALSLVLREQRRALQQTHIAARLDAMTGAQRSAWDALQNEYRNRRAALARSLADGWTLSARELRQLEHRTREQDAQLRALLDRGVAILNHSASAVPQTLPARPTLAAWRGRSQWHVLVSRNATIEHVAVDCPADEPAQIATCVLGAASAALRGVVSLDLLIDHDLAAVDWHAVPFGDVPLLAAFAVRYRSGLTPTDGAHPTPGLATLVADPSGNLSAARDEVDDVRAQLAERADWRQTLLRGQSADAAAVIQSIEQSALFHYAGHAEFGGHSGWDSALRLGHDTQLGIGDILTLVAAPQVVVLSGCETALRPDVSTPAMGLANAFLSSGARAVIATSRSVDDRSARAVMTQFYERWLGGNAIDDALRMAQLSVRDTQPELDWSAFRLMTP